MRKIGFFKEALLLFKIAKNEQGLDFEFIFREIRENR